jgi:ABC-type uncharacterized transport system involved in gliding motility auxiliary subunit
VDEVRSIPLFAFEREAFLEYELTRIIYDLTHPKKVKVGILSSRNMLPSAFMGLPGLGGSRGWVVAEQISNVFDVVEVKKDATELPKDIDVLMLVQPKELTSDMLYSIDQYLLAGGHALFFVDPNAEGDNGFTSDDASYMPEFSKILRAWGVKIEPDRVLADRKAARRVNSNASEKGYVDYLPWLELGVDNIEQEDLVTSMLTGIHMASVGAIEAIGESVEFLPLLYSNKQAMLLPTSSIKGAPQPNALLRKFISDNKSYVIAARISGMAKTAFPNQSKSGHLNESVKPSNIVLVSDSDMLRDPFWVRTQDYEGYRIAVPMAENGVFVVNALDHLSGSADLISLRSRGTASRPFTVVEELKREAEERYLKKEELLKKKLEETELNIARLQEEGNQQTGNVLLFKQEQKDAIRKFSQEAVEIRKELRYVQRELKRGIERLGSILKFLNVLLGPIIIVLISIFVLVYRVQKNAEARQKAKTKKS